MIRFLLSSFLFLSVISCAPKITKGLTEVPPTKSLVYNPYFADTSKDYIYKAKLDIYGNYFGGILIIKKISEQKKRVVFTTEFGSKIFDFQYDGDTFVKNFVLPDLDKKIIVNTLKKDFRILITENAKVSSQFLDQDYTIYTSDKKDGGNAFFVNRSSEELYSIANAPNERAKILFRFDEIQDSVARKITINHNNIKLSIDLEYLKK